MAADHGEIAAAEGGRVRRRFLWWEGRAEVHRSLFGGGVSLRSEWALVRGLTPQMVERRIAAKERRSQSRLERHKWKGTAR